MLQQLNSGIRLLSRDIRKALHGQGWVTEVDGKHCMNDWRNEVLLVHVDSCHVQSFGDLDFVDNTEQQVEFCGIRMKNNNLTEKMPHPCAV